MFHNIPRGSIANYFIPCLNLRKIYGKSPKTSETLQTVFEEFFQILKIFGKPSEVFGNCGKTSETV